MKPYRLLFDKVLIRTDPERAHETATKAIRLGRPFATLLPDKGIPVQAMGLTFPGPLGLAAGFDKNAESVDALAALGFSFVEIGTVTGEPQAGNPKPRLFRLVEDRAVVNRMGFNNDGAEVVARRLASRKHSDSWPSVSSGGGERARKLAAPKPSRHAAGSDVIVGVNIGKTKVVPEDEAIADYEKSTRLLAPYADYLVVNVSSPNTPGLRDLQAVDKLKPLLAAVRTQADQTVPSRHVPLLVKIAPDLSDEDVLAVSDLAVSLGLDGIVATNTTISRDGLKSPCAAEVGGVSGAPLKQRALEVTRLVRERVGPDLTIIGVGGITTAEDAWDRLEAGATLVQGYTAFIYEGPLWPRRIQRQLTAIARRRAPRAERAKGVGEAPQRRLHRGAGDPGQARASAPSSPPGNPSEGR